MICSASFFTSADWARDGARSAISTAWRWWKIIPCAKAVSAALCWPCEAEGEGGARTCTADVGAAIGTPAAAGASGRAPASAGGAYAEPIPAAAHVPSACARCPELPSVCEHAALACSVAGAWAMVMACSGAGAPLGASACMPRIPASTVSTSSANSGPAGRRLDRVLLVMPAIVRIHTQQRGVEGLARCLACSAGTDSSREASHAEQAPLRLCRCPAAHPVASSSWWAVGVTPCRRSRVLVCPGA